MYCTIEDITDDLTLSTLIELSNDNSGADSVDEAIVNSKIEEVSIYIDSYVMARYSLPLSDPNALLLLKKIAVDLIVCGLFQRRYRLEYSDALAMRKKQAISDLEKIQKGLLQLLPTTVEQQKSKGVYKVSKTNRYFNDELMEQL